MSLKEVVYPNLLLIWTIVDKTHWNLRLFSGTLRKKLSEIKGSDFLILISVGFLMVTNLPEALFPLRKISSQSILRAKLCPFEKYQTVFWNFGRQWRIRCFHLLVESSSCRSRDLPTYGGRWTVGMNPKLTSKKTLNHPFPRWYRSPPETKILRQRDHYKATQFVRWVAFYNGVCPVEQFWK